MDPRTANDALFHQAELLGFLCFGWQPPFLLEPSPPTGGRVQGEGGSLRAQRMRHLTWQAFHQPFHVGFDRKHR